MSSRAETPTFTHASGGVAPSSDAVKKRVLESTPVRWGARVVSYPFNDAAKAGHVAKGVAIGAEWVQRTSSNSSTVLKATKVAHAAGHVSAFCYAARIFTDVEDVKENWEKWDKALQLPKSDPKRATRLWKAKKNVVASSLNATTCATGLGVFLHDVSIVEAGKAVPVLGFICNLTSLVSETLELIHDVVKLQKNINKYADPATTAATKSWAVKKIIHHTLDIFKRIAAIALACLSLVAIGFILAGFASPISPMVFLGLGTGALALTFIVDFYGDSLKAQKEDMKAGKKPALAPPLLAQHA